MRESVARDQLRAIFERIERLEDEPDEDEVAVPAFLKRGREAARDLEPA